MTSVNSQPITFLKGAMTPRPTLPAEWNEHLATFDIAAVDEPVKFQIITREGQDIVIGRVKVPTNVKHAFILRRFDTGAISLSTMFRASYPTATQEAEKAESTWVKANFDTSGANGGGKLRLAGTWVSPLLAKHIAKSYQIDHIVAPLANASPEAAQYYRKSVKSSTPNPSVDANIGRTPSQVTTATSPKSAAAASPRSVPVRAVSPVRAQPPTKRRRESPSPATTPPQVAARSRATPVKQTAPSSSPIKSASKRKPARIEQDEEPEVPGPNPEDDIAEQKALIARLKSEAEAAAVAAAAAVQTASALEHTPLLEVPATPTATKKRSLEEQTPPVKFDLERIKEVEEQAASGLVVDRPIIPLKRQIDLNPQQKAFAWGSLAFAVGIAATTYLPSFWL